MRLTHPFQIIFPVELVDAHHGFKFITDRIKTKNPIVLLWVVCGVAFFLSAVLDNLTTTIVMVSLIRKLIPDKEMRLFFAGMIVIAANAGGAWSPIGDVTTIMLWIGGQVTALNIVTGVFLPSLVCLLVPLLVVTFTQKGEIKRAKKAVHESVSGRPSSKEQKLAPQGDGRLYTRLYLTAINQRH